MINLLISCELTPCISCSKFYTCVMNHVLTYLVFRAGVTVDLLRIYVNETF